MSSHHHQDQDHMVDFLQGKLNEMSAKLKMATDTCSEANEARKTAQMTAEHEKAKVAQLTKMVRDVKQQCQDKETEHRREMRTLQKKMSEVEKEANNIVNGYLKKREKWCGRISVLEQKLIIQEQEPQR